MYNANIKYCPYCGTINPKIANYCRHCGKPFYSHFNLSHGVHVFDRPKSTRCPQCGYCTRRLVPFCPLCGYQMHQIHTRPRIKIN